MVCVIRKAIKNRKIFPRDQSALKVVYMAINSAAKRWTMPIRNWKPALNRFMGTSNNPFLLQSAVKGAMLR